MDMAYVLLETGVRAPLDKRVGEAERAAQLLVLVCKVHGGEERQSLVLWLHAGYGEVSRKLEGSLLVFVGEGAKVC